MSKRDKNKRIEELESRVAVLEFKEAAKGERFVLGCTCGGFPRFVQEVKWLSDDGKRVITDKIRYTPNEKIKLNGKYIEVCDKSSYGKVYRAYRVKEDTLVDMDVDVYIKAFYPETPATEEEKTESPKVTQWKVGDRVRCIKAYEGNYDAVGKEGRIVKFVEQSGRTLIGVRFDEPCKFAHSLNGAVAPYHGWWFADPAEYLVKL